MCHYKRKEKEKKGNDSLADFLNYFKRRSKFYYRLMELEASSMNIFIRIDFGQGTVYNLFFLANNMDKCCYTK